MHGVTSGRTPTEDTGLPYSTSNPGERMILIIEDDETTREVTARILMLEGHTVLTAEDGRQALTILEEHRPSLIFSDLRMPGLDGWNFRRLQQQSPDLAAIPLIIVSAAMNLEHEGQVLSVTATIAKPADIDDILRYARKYDSERL